MMYYSYKQTKVVSLLNKHLFYILGTIYISVTPSSSLLSLYIYLPNRRGRGKNRQRNIQIKKNDKVNVVFP